MKQPLFLSLVGALSALFGATFSAVASQEDFFKGLGNGLGGEEVVRESGGDPTRLLMMIALLVGGLLLLVWIVQARKSAAARGMHHPGKLVREVSKKLGLKPAQLKKLKAMSEDANVSNPLVLLLCPSLMAESMRRKK